MNEKQTQLNKMVKGGLILTASSFIAKLLSALYKVPFQNLTGDAGFYVYQQIYPIYGLAVAFTLNGFPTFVSKVVSEADDEQSLQKRLRELNTWFVLIGLGMFLLLQVGANNLATLMGDPQLTPVIKSVSIFFLFLPFLALVRGYFQGQSNMVPTSLSQVVEQLVRVLILLGVALYFTQSTWTAYEMGTNAYHSSWLSALAGSIVLGVYLRRDERFENKLGILKPRLSLEMGWRLLSEGGLFIATSSIMILFQFIDSFTVFKGLLAAGLSNEMAMSLKGVYDRGQPLVQLGLVVGLGFATSSLPLLRKWALENRWKEWTESAASLLKITLLLAGAATIGLIAVMPWMNFTLFTDNQGTLALQIYVISVLLAAMIYSIHTILQSTGQKDSTVLFLIVGLAFKMLLNQFVVRIMGIEGSSIVTVFSLIIIFVLMMQKVRKAVWQEVLRNNFLPKIIFLLGGLYGVVRGSIVLLEKVFFISGRAGSLFLTLFGVAIGVLFFSAGTFATNILNETELNQLSLSKIINPKKRK